MSWNPRDYTTGRSVGAEQPGPAPALPLFDDTDPLPTYVSGDEFEVTAEPSIPLWQRRAMRDQGLCTPEQLDRWAQILTRGITPV